MALKKDDAVEKTPAELAEAAAIQKEKDDKAAAIQKEKDDKVAAEKKELEEKAAAQKVLDDKAAAEAAQKIRDDADQQARDDQAAADKAINDAREAREALSKQEAVSLQKTLDDENEVAMQAGRASKERVLVEVLNLRNSDFRQPETGTWIMAHSRAWLLRDGWLANQIEAKLMVEV